MSLFIFCGYYLLQAISKNSFLAELCIQVPAHVATEQYLLLTTESELSDKIESSECVCVCVCVVETASTGCTCIHT